MNNNLRKMQLEQINLIKIFLKTKNKKWLKLINTIPFLSVNKK